MTGRNPVMKVKWKREKVVRSVQETLRRMMIAVVTWTLLTIVSDGKDKTKWGKVKISTHIHRRWKNILTNSVGSLVKDEDHCALHSLEMSQYG
jgi:hypothetical protein